MRLGTENTQVSLFQNKNESDSAHIYKYCGDTCVFVRLIFMSFNQVVSNSNYHGGLAELCLHLTEHSFYSRYSSFYSSFGTGLNFTNDEYSFQSPSKVKRCSESDFKRVLAISCDQCNIGEMRWKNPLHYWGIIHFSTSRGRFFLWGFLSTLSPIIFLSHGFRRCLQESRYE